METKQGKNKTNRMSALACSLADLDADLSTNTLAGVGTAFERWPRDPQLLAWRKGLQEGDVLDVSSGLFGDKIDEAWIEVPIAHYIPKYQKYSRSKRKQNTQLFSSFVSARPCQGVVVSVKNNLEVHAFGRPDCVNQLVSAQSEAVQPLYSRSRPWRMHIDVQKKLDVQIGRHLWVVGQVVGIDKHTLRIDLSSSEGPCRTDGDGDGRAEASGAVKTLSRFSAQIGDLGVHTAITTKKNRKKGKQDPEDDSDYESEYE